LARYERRLTWLGEVTFRLDDMPWDQEAELKKPVDDDLTLVCRRMTQHYRREILDAAQRSDPAAACRVLGCGVGGGGRAVQVDPGFSQLTPRLLSALETEI